MKLHWNKALWLAVPSHMTVYNQSNCFNSATVILLLLLRLYYLLFVTLLGTNSFVCHYFLSFLSYLYLCISVYFNFDFHFLLIIPFICHSFASLTDWLHLFLITNSFLQTFTFSAFCCPLSSTYLFPWIYHTSQESISLNIAAKYLKLFLQLGRYKNKHGVPP